MQAVTTTAPGIWDDAIRAHDRRVYLSVLALGLTPERAKEIAQSAWTMLIERQVAGTLTEIELPGLALKQARFLALTELARQKTERRILAAVPAEPVSDPEREIASRAEMKRVLAALATCSPQARRIFRLVYATPGGSAATAAADVGLSLQRVRQILCETRAHIRKQLSASEVTP